MARKLTAFSILMLVCTQAFGIALLCQMPCCPDSKLPAMQMQGADTAMPGMSMASHHHLNTASVVDTANLTDRVSQNACSVAFKGSEPQILRDNVAPVPQPLGTDSETCRPTDAFSAAVSHVFLIDIDALSPAPIPLRV